MTAVVSLPQAWTENRKIVFRFFAAYFIITLFPFPLNAVPVLDETAESLSAWLWSPLIRFTARHILHIPGEIVQPNNGSGDTTYHYIQQGLALVLSLLVCLAWSIAGKKQKSYRRFSLCITILVRYYLAFIMLYYGFSKVFPTQFPFPSLYTLIESYGQSSPMRLAWSFMGYSKGYNLFTGLAEVTAGCLLFFRKTTLTGALLAVIIMINVLAINLSYDVPVKLYSMNLVAMGLFLIAPHARGLYDFFIRHRSPAAVSQEEPVTRKWIRPAGIVLKIIAITGALYLNIKDNYEYRLVSQGKSPLYGIYDVDGFTINDTIRLPLQTDDTRWKKLVIDQPGYAGIQQMNDSIRFYRMEADTVQKQITLSPLSDTIPVYSLYYAMPDQEHLLLWGTRQQDSLRIGMKRFDLNRFNLVSREFHWISERPYNR